MFPYLPTTDAERAGMLRAIGATSIDDLFACVPEALRLRQPLDLPRPHSEWEVMEHFRGLEHGNLDPEEVASFLGAGLYRHRQPTAVDALIQRAEFFTAYTPYQPEVSQGTLQAIFEWQTLLCQLTAMEVSNASLYEGASAVTEAVLMAERLRKGSRVVVSAGLHPEYRQTLRSYLASYPLKVVEVPLGPDGRTDTAAWTAAVGEDAVAAVVQSPNFFGCIEDLARLLPQAQQGGALAVVAIAEAVSLGLLKPPGELGADIVAGEAASFGLAASYGGPLAGFLTTRDAYKRDLPGRLVGQTVDAEGRRGFVLTLATREQHIRRAKATSNICTNQGLFALVATITLCLWGPVGLRRIAQRCQDYAAYAQRRLTAIPRVRAVYGAPFFNEFALELPRPAAEVIETLSQRGILGGVDLGRWYPERRRELLVACTECNSKEQIDQYAAALAELLRS